MGYRSTVAIGIAFPNREALVAFLTTVKLDNTMPPEELAHYKVDEFKDMVLLHARFEDVKWYDSYDDVKCHQNMLNCAYERNYGTAFVRIGEEDNDIEIDVYDQGEGYDLWSFFNVHREVVSPGGGTNINEYMKQE
jgi:hypothetical protein